MSLIYLKRVVLAGLKIRNCCAGTTQICERFERILGDNPNFYHRLRSYNFCTYLTNTMARPKRKAHLEAAAALQQEQDSPSPEKRRKVTKKRVQKATSKRKQPTSATPEGNDRDEELLGAGTSEPTVTAIAKSEPPGERTKKEVTTAKRTGKKLPGISNVDAEVDGLNGSSSNRPRRQKQPETAAEVAGTDEDGQTVEIEQENPVDPEEDKAAESAPKRRGRKNVNKQLAETEDSNANKGTKNTTELAEQDKEPNDNDELNGESALKRTGRGRKRVAQEHDEIVPNKSSKKTTKSAQSNKVDTKPTLLNVTDTKWDEIDFSCDKKCLKKKGYNLKITSWNVDGIRAWLKKGGLKILEYDKPDILCLQETKCSKNKLPHEVVGIPGYHDYWVSSEKEGYAGVGVLTKILPTQVIYGINKDEHDSEGRCLTLEFEGFYLVNVYVPNAGRGLVTLPKRLEWNEHFKSFVKNLDEIKPVIICGDMNVAHNEIDLANPKTNKKNAGFTQEERDGMTDFLQDGYIDSFRILYPDEANVYTFWSYMNKSRSKNVGWRLDYFILSEGLKDKICDSIVRSQVYGSDHCPISLFISI